jgi:hypothetical protein
VAPLDVLGIPRRKLLQQQQPTGAAGKRTRQASLGARKKSLGVHPKLDRVERDLVEKEKLISRSFFPYKRKEWEKYVRRSCFETSFSFSKVLSSPERRGERGGSSSSSSSSSNLLRASYGLALPMHKDRS